MRRLEVGGNGINPASTWSSGHRACRCRPEARFPSGPFVPLTSAGPRPQGRVCAGRHFPRHFPFFNIKSQERRRSELLAWPKAIRTFGPARQLVSYNSPSFRRKNALDRKIEGVPICRHISHSTRACRFSVPDKAGDVKITEFMTEREWKTS